MSKDTSKEKRSGADSTIERSVCFYSDVVTARTHGPQLEGLDDEWVHAALRDPKTKIVETHDVDGNVVQWPLLVDIRHDGNYSQVFFEKNYPNQQIYSLCVPPHSSIGQIIESGMLEGVMAGQDGAKVAVSYVESELPTSIEKALVDEIAEKNGLTASDVTPITYAFGGEYGYASVSHFMSIVRPVNREGVNVPAEKIGDFAYAFDAMVADERVERMPENGVTVLSGEELGRDNDRLFDALWNMYEPQFSQLVSDHPSLQMQPKEELREMVMRSDSLNVAYMQDGEPVSFCYFVRPQSCIWLNSTYFDALEQNTPDVKQVYFPGIVVEESKARQGNRYASEMLICASQLFKQSGADFCVTFQTTNVSETYIPGIVTHVINKDGILKFDNEIDSSGSAFDKVAQYNYRVLSLDRWS